MRTTLLDRVRRLFPSSWRRFYRNAKLVFTADQEFLLKRLSYDEKNVHGLSRFVLRHAHPALVAPSQYKSDINRHEQKVYSQNGEDGILLHLFSTVGVTDRRFVEFGVSDGRECNAANLVLNFGWRGLMLEADRVIFGRASRFYDALLVGDDRRRVTLAQALVTAENINDLLRKHEHTGEIDLLSIDIDSNDYWVWKAITAVSPRVVVIEYNASLGYDTPITVTYDPAFKRFGKHRGGYYHGTSLPAAVKLGTEKGYVFVGCDSTGANAFFVRRDVAEGKVTAVTVAQAYYPHARRSRSRTTEEQFAQIKHLPFTTV